MVALTDGTQLVRHSRRNVRLLGRPLLGTLTGWVRCEQTLRVVSGSGEVLDLPCGGCDTCSARRRREVTECAEVGLRMSPARFRYLLTLTCPSGVDIATWNASAGKRWNHFSTDLRRLVQEKNANGRLEYFRAVEPQDGKRRTDGQARWALHLHVLITSDVPLSGRAVQRRAVNAGFGRIFDLKPVSDDERAAQYVAKYINKARQQRRMVPWPGRAEGNVASYRSFSRSQGFGISVAEVRARRHRRFMTDWVAAAADEQANPYLTPTNPEPFPP